MGSLDLRHGEKDGTGSLPIRRPRSWACRINALAMNARFKCFPGCLTLSTTDRASVSPPQARVTITFTTVSRLTKNLSRQACPEPCRRDAKHAKKDPLSFRPKGEIFLRSLASARDDGPRPVTLAPFALRSSSGWWVYRTTPLRETRFSDLFFIRTFQISLASIHPATLQASRLSRKQSQTSTR